MKKGIYIIITSIVSLLIGLYVGATYLEEEIKSFTSTEKIVVEKKNDNWKKDYKLSIMRTGYIAKSTNYKPTINFKITRLIKQSNPPYVKVKVVFHDSKSGKSIETKSSQIEPFHPLNKRFLIIANRGFSDISSKDLIAKIYINNQITREVKIVKADFHRR